MSGDNSHGGGHEQDVNPRAALWVIPLSAFLLVAYVVTGWFWGTASLSREMAIKQAGGAEPMREGFKAFGAQEDEILSQYKWKDKEKGLVQIPVERAMDLVAQEAAHSAEAAKPASSKTEVKAKPKTTGKAE